MKRSARTEYDFSLCQRGYEVTSSADARIRLQRFPQA